MLRELLFLDLDFLDRDGYAVHYMLGDYQSRLKSIFDVFTEGVEILIKYGIANLYWYKGDLHKALGGRQVWLILVC